MARKIIQFCALVLALSGAVESQKNREVTEPDMIRNIYLKIEKTLWETVVTSGSKSQSDKLKQIYFDHNNFVNTFLMDSVDINDLKQLIETNGWHQLQSDIVNVHRLFVSFRQHIARETRNSNKETFNEETTLDLSMHILNDAHWPLKSSLDNLVMVTIKHKLYSQDIAEKFSCHFQRSVQQIIYQLYSALTIVETEAFMMTQWAHMVRTVYQKGEINKKNL